jgi:hypothetical protein
LAKITLLLPAKMSNVGSENTFQMHSGDGRIGPNAHVVAVDDSTLHAYILFKKSPIDIGTSARELLFPRSTTPSQAARGGNKAQYSLPIMMSDDLDSCLLRFPNY